jgi:hypothetical protein
MSLVSAIVLTWVFLVTNPDKHGKRLAERTLSELFGGVLARGNKCAGSLAL